MKADFTKEFSIKLSRECTPTLFADHKDFDDKTRYRYVKLWALVEAENPNAYEKKMGEKRSLARAKNKANVKKAKEKKKKKAEEKAMKQAQENAKKRQVGARLLGTGNQSIAIMR